MNQLSTLGGQARALVDATVALAKIAAADGCRPGHISYMTKAEMSACAQRCLDRLAAA